MKKAKSNSSLRRGVSTRLNSKKSTDSETNKSSFLASNTTRPLKTQKKKTLKKEENSSKKGTYDHLSYQIRSQINSAKSTRSDLQVNTRRPGTQQKISSSIHFSKSYLANITDEKSKQNAKGTSSPTFNSSQKDAKPQTQRSYTSMHRSHHYNLSFGNSSFKEGKRSSNISNKKPNDEKIEQGNKSINKQKTQDDLNIYKQASNSTMLSDVVENNKGNDGNITHQETKNENNEKQQKRMGNNIDAKIKDSNIKLDKNTANQDISKSKIIMNNSYVPEFKPIFVNQRPALTEIPPGAISVDFVFFQQIMTQIQKSILELQKKFDDKICTIQKKIAKLEFSISELQT